MTDVRLVATRLLTELLSQQGSIASLMPDAQKQISERDSALLQQLCYGCTREFFRLDALAQHLLKKPFQSKDYDLYAVLLLGLYQLREMRIPEHAVVHETVELTRLLNKDWAKGLINAVLRRYQREAISLDQTLSQQSDAYHWNHPAWILDKLKHNWPEQWQSILVQNDIKGPLTLRVNKHLLSREEYLNRLLEDDITAKAGVMSDQAIILDEAMDVHLLPGFDQGWCSVQDEVAQLSGYLLDAQAGEHLLDACAAPGGKLGQLLELLPESTSVTALELSESRSQRIRDNLQRLNFSHRCQLINGDAASQDWWDGNLYDRILLDAPCSGSGVIRRNPDIKLLRQNEDLLKLASLQLSILSNLWGLLKPGGTLLYATCSVFPQENERIIERFCKQQPDALHQPLELPWGQARPMGQQFFPQLHSHDGFFYAKLIKSTDTGLTRP
ncbi:16S rRNA (cytosine(967)-C(5))-methyltransferase RsmB [Nitrincola iocasae]|uniref:16S rRNA (cytosine(967)-C(5))-methyltransferase n=1 Tax=Nitrincola iocasae TaxID=2614693 RepID=A0A5J6L9H8_9GAMM|nr:16S rRNA (cytosine(967)-C(5))-methyltransferase RsmB [Nitrincola iocasae]QEW05018.1 16S rRNA (cytosine(967)-C(5))-methyltransferase RsmB [Nitrincola iocasae]